MTFGLTVHCRMRCGEDSAPCRGKSYNDFKYCKHCTSIMPKELSNCFCCGHKLRNKSHYYKRTESN